MGAFFQGRRRKLRLATLALAVVVSGMWWRSFHYVEWLRIGSLRVDSHAGVLTWLSSTDEPRIEIASFPFDPKSRFIVPLVGRLWCWPTPPLNDGTRSTIPISEEYWRIPYWPIAITIVALAALLLFWPRSRKPTEAVQTTATQTPKNRIWRRVIMWGIPTFLILFVVGLIVSWMVAGALVAPASRDIGDAPADLPATPIFLVSDSGSTVKGWHIRSSSPRGVIVLLHGIHESRLTMLERARFLTDAGYAIVMIDFQAHGESPGQQITVGHLEKHDVRAAVKYARKVHPGERIGVIGVSLGGASALLASPLEIDALVLESVYPDIQAAIHNRVAARLGPLSYVPTEILLVQLKLRLGIDRSQLRPIDFISKVDCPVFVISGSEDLHTTPVETERLLSAAAEPKESWLVDGAAHVDLCRVAPEEYRERILKFFEKHLR